MAYQLTIYDVYCNRCNDFIAEYNDSCEGDLCDGCYIKLMGAWYDFFMRYGYKDYSDAVKKDGREFINNKFKIEKWFT